MTTDAVQPHQRFTALVNIRPLLCTDCCQLCGALGKQLGQEEIRDAQPHKLSLMSVNTVGHQNLDLLAHLWYISQQGLVSKMTFYLGDQIIHKCIDILC